jgi:hypothetical protein
MATMHEGAAKGQSKQKWGGRIGKAGSAVTGAAAVSAVVPGGQVAAGPLALVGAGLKAGGNALSAAGNAQEAAAAHQVAKYTPEGEYGAADAVREHAVSKGAGNALSAVDAVVPLPPIVSAVANVAEKAHTKSIESRLGKGVGQGGRDAIAAEEFQKKDAASIRRAGRGDLAMFRDKLLGRDATIQNFTDLDSDAHRVAAELRETPREE